MFTLENNSLKIKVKSFGAELCSVTSNDENIEYIWQADTTVWARHAPNLFPIVGKLKNDSYVYNEHTHQLPQHGFARDNEFNLIEQTNNRIVFEFKENETTLKNYPFKFTFKVSYTLLDNKVNVDYQVINTDNKDLLFSVGAHPAFNCPLTPLDTFEDYELLFPNADKLTINTLSNGLISNSKTDLKLKNHKINISKKLFASDALVFTNGQCNNVSLVSTKTKHGVTVFAENWPYYGIWSKRDSDQFVCLEPWHGIADFENTTQEFTVKTGIITLQPQKEFNCHYSISFF